MDTLPWVTLNDRTLSINTADTGLESTTITIHSDIATSETSVTGTDLVLTVVFVACSTTTLNDITMVGADDTSTTPVTKYVAHGGTGSVIFVVPTIQAEVVGSSIDCGAITYSVTKNELGEAFTEAWVTIADNGSSQLVSFTPSSSTVDFPDSTKTSVNVYIKATLADHATTYRYYPITVTACTVASSIAPSLNDI